MIGTPKLLWIDLRIWIPIKFLWRAKKTANFHWNNAKVKATLVDQNDRWVAWINRKLRQKLEFLNIGFGYVARWFCSTRAWHTNLNYIVYKIYRQLALVPLLTNFLFIFVSLLFFCVCVWIVVHAVDMTRICNVRACLPHVRNTINLKILSYFVCFFPANLYGDLIAPMINSRKINRHFPDIWRNRYSMRVRGEKNYDKLWISNAGKDSRK